MNFGHSNHVKKWWTRMANLDKNLVTQYILICPTLSLEFILSLFLTSEIHSEEPFS